MKAFVRDTPIVREAALLTQSFFFSIGRAPAGLYTLCYHHVSAGSRESFARQLRLLQNHGTFVDADRAVDLVQNGPISSGRYFLMSFDDGYADNHDVALPVLAELCVPAILFLVSSWLDHPPEPSGDRRAYMSRGDVAAWIGEGMSIGSHSHTHPQFSRLERSQAEHELVTSRDVLSDLARRPIQHFACPWGVPGRDFDALRDPPLARACGYRTFFTSSRGVAADASDLTLMPRHVLEPEWARFQLHALMGR